MSSRLDRVGNWVALASQAEFRGSKLAKACGISLRQLERYFQSEFGMPLNHWLRRERMKAAARYLRSGKPIKEVMNLLHYKQQSHFGRHFKEEYGVGPGAFASQSCRLSVTTKSRKKPFGVAFR